MKWTTEHVTTDRPLTSNTDVQWRNGDAPDFWVWHLSSVQLKLWLPFPLGCIKSCMCTAKFIWVFRILSWCMETLQQFCFTCDSTDEGPENVTGLFCSSLLFIEHSLTYYPKCHRAKSTKRPILTAHSYQSFVMHHWSVLC